VGIAAKYEEMHMERVSVLRRKIEAQQAELALAEREVGQMTAELKAVMSGADPRAGIRPPLETADDPTASTSGLRDEIDALDRARARAEAEANADRRLEELKRKMGK
jgi:hypothetical protein